MTMIANASPLPLTFSSVFLHSLSSCGENFRGNFNWGT